MQIRLSRHAKRRIRLYRLPEDKIIELVQSQPVRLGQHEVITRVEGVALPVKIVYANEFGPNRGYYGLPSQIEEV